MSTPATTPRIVPVPTAPAATPRLPPGPRAPAVWQTLRLYRDWSGYLEECRERYGDAFTLNFTAIGRWAYFSDPGVLKQVFQGHPDVYLAGEARAMLEPVVGRRSVLVLDGEEHMRARRLLLPSFQGNHVRTHERTMQDATRAELARWPSGEPFALRPHLQTITLDIVLRAIFGMDADERRADMHRAIVRLLAVATGPFVMIPILARDLGPFSPGGILARRRAAVDELVYAQIAERRADPAAGERDDVLSVLLGARDEDGHELDDETLRDELMTLLLAGHETTATALAWAIERLVRHPGVLRRLLAELEDEPAGGRYLDAVIKETLRVRPVIGDVGRMLGTTAEIGGYTMPAGTMVAPAIATVHLDGDAYDEPEAFRPERWLEDSPPGQAWIPFGAGRRSCLGAGFALFEMKVVLRTILSALTLRPARPQDERARVRNITLVPGRGAEVIATPR
ncbi:MAG TPA: cytochrome P450 [Solirubrobacteraceae bacterium]|nr:cytochrome P450 [Solirubrobacteraceae bacterium]